MRDRNLPPSRRSTLLLVVCQSSEALFHFLISPGLFQASQTGVKPALTTVSTVIVIGCSSCGERSSTSASSEGWRNRHGRGFGHSHVVRDDRVSSTNRAVT